MTIKNVATYGQNGEHLTELKEINFLYGSNGSGKTTISEYLRSSIHDKYRDCSYDSSGGNYDIVVYNRNFVEENFKEYSNIKGIFTLGEASKELQEKIEELQEDIEKYESKIIKVEENIKEKEKEKKSVEDKFKNRVWKVMKKHEEEFKDTAFKGLRNKKEKFMERFIQEAEKLKNRAPISLQELLKRQNSIFSQNPEELNYLKEISLKKDIENKEIFNTKIVGKEDLDIAKLISHLNISDWVREGHKHMKNSDGICPFCQQDLPEGFEEELESYFDTTYTTQINQLNKDASDYEEYAEVTLQNVKELIKIENEYLNKEEIEQLLNLIESKFRNNKLLIEKKKKEPSRAVKIVSIVPEVNAINAVIKKANEEIKNYNNIINNLKEEKKILINDIWHYIVEENKQLYNDFKSKLTTINKALEGMNESHKQLRGYIDEKDKELKETDKKVTSVENTVNEINAYLNKFGFTNFRLSTTKEKGKYRIIREDGEDVGDTLSEGEKTFITFLYFYYLIQGSNNAERIRSKKIVVIDDPVSSLDSNVLFVVSNLVRNIMEDIRNKRSNIKQLFVFTHNVYFHKEVSFDYNNHNDSKKDESYWIIKKINNKSKVERCDKNPIKSSYELLWNELKLTKDHNLLTIQNVMRRILETYFKFFGGVDIRKEIEKFEGQDKIIGRSLFSWVNDGSHHINEDLEVERSIEEKQQYLKVFKRIFCESGHESHFNMMTKDFPEDMFGSKAAEAKKVVTSEIQQGIEQIASIKEEER